MQAPEKSYRSIRDQLKDGPQTVPDIAAATGGTTAETLWYVAALKKYGEIKEAEKDGGYFKLRTDRSGNSGSVRLIRSEPPAGSPKT
jgi:hypothetical protein